MLESGEIRRVGDNHPITVDVRVVCATHRSLEEMVSAGSFREDLLFRLNTFEIRVPALREHMSDLLLLIRHFIEQKQQSVPEGFQFMTDEAIEIMQAYDWPGNVRELANCVEHAMVLCDELPIRLEHLPFRIQGAERIRSSVISGSGDSGTNASEQVIHKKSEARIRLGASSRLKCKAFLMSLIETMGTSQEPPSNLVLV